ncbi:hypothetical protein RSA11_04425 [Exiguobacterium indicum]|uniref:Uncharacterized protein n=1 Tax=Exiguobacterium indicum TaxID=296995 RepID=A0AAW3MFL4_9BACL|nr:hypothetical protein [Exiguobacterium indicum]KTR27913.1 hypothetical protein RSA11_04425 [Exiguobacterium indicum]
MVWVQEVKNRMQEEIKLRSYNEIKEILEVVEVTFKDIEAEFKSISYQNKKVVNARIDEDSSVYAINLNTLKRPGGSRLVYCTISNKGINEAYINVAVVVSEVDTDFVDIAGIHVGKEKPVIRYLDAAEDYRITQKEEYFSPNSLKALVGNIFNYGY